MIRVALAAAILASVPVTSAAQAAQSQEENDSGFLDWLQSNGVQIRKTFDGSKNEGRPASFNFLLDRSVQDTWFSQVDAALKVTEIEFQPGGSLLLVYPVIEWHRNNAEASPTNALTWSLKGEYRPVALRPRGTDSGGWLVAPTVLLEGSWTRNFEQDSASTHLSVFAFPSSLVGGLPGSQVIISDQLWLRWYPYAGLEWTKPAMPGTADAAAFAAGRIHLELRPLITETRSLAYLTGSYTYRRKLNTFDALPDNLHEWSLGVTFYLDSEEAFGVGLDYENGRQPKKGFKEQDMMTIGFKLKI